MPVPDDTRKRFLDPNLALVTNNREGSVHLLGRLAGVPQSVFENYYLSALIQYAGLAQAFPSSYKNSDSDGHTLIDHDLGITTRALKIRQAYLLPPSGEAEAISQQQDIWTYGVFTAALLQSVGHAALNVVIEAFNSTDTSLGNWSPLSGPPPSNAVYYRIRQATGTPEVETGTVNLLIASLIVPSAGMDWIASNRMLFDFWLGAVAKDRCRASVLGEILIAAGAEFPPSATENEAMLPEEPVPEVIVAEEPVSDRLEPIQRKMDTNTDSDTDDPFVVWLRTQLKLDRIEINDKHSLVYRIPQGIVLATPQLFIDFACAMGDRQNWGPVEKRFLRLHLHRPNSGAGAFHRFEFGNGSHVQGLLIPDTELLFPEEAPPIHPDLQLSKL